MWTIINKNLTKRPISVNEYAQYKSFLRVEAEEKCVYCAIHENPLGGSDHFHVEHYKPKSLTQFASLEKDYNNLFYACAICNRFKSNDWPNNPLPDHSVVAYPDPKSTNYNTLFRINEKTGEIKGKFTASRYIVEKIFLNRPQLINERRENHLRGKLNLALVKIENQMNMLRNKKGHSRAFDLLDVYSTINREIIELFNNERSISKYRPSEIKRLKR